MSELTHGSLCTGYGGLDMAASAVFGGRLAWWSDIEPGPIAVMEKHHPGVPNLGDIKTIDWARVPPVDLLTAGYPCQPFSNAGKRLGTDDPRHLWPWIAVGIKELRPQIVVLENVAAHLGRGFHEVLTDLDEIGFDAEWAVVRASDVGAPHRRARLFVVAQDADRATGGERGQPAPGQTEGGRSRPDIGGRGRTPLADPEGERRHERRSEHAGLERATDAAGDSGDRWGTYAAAVDRWRRITGRVAPEPTVTGARGATVLSPFLVEWMMGLPEGHVTSVDGLSRNQMLGLLGNGVVPQQAEYALSGLWDRFIQERSRDGVQRHDSVL